MSKLPKALEREPLVDALFEARLVGSPPLADILPGILFHELDPKPSIVRLPAAEIPQPMRESDERLRYAPIQRVEWENYFIAVGDRNVVIGCKLPYPRWAKFKATILDIVGRIASVGVTGNVERFSLKYVNIIQAPSLEAQIAKINLAIRIGSLEVTNEHINLQVHHVEDNAVHILTVITGANGKMQDGRSVHGIVVDIDSIRNIDAIDFAAFSAGLEPELQKLKLSNKARFFDCLRQETLDEMGPIYE